MPVSEVVKATLDPGGAPRDGVTVLGGEPLRVSENLCKRTKWSKQPYFRKDSEPCPFNQNRRHPKSIRILSISCSPAARQPERLKTFSKTSARHSLKAPSMAN